MTAPKAKKPAKPPVSATVNVREKAETREQIAAKIFERVAKGESLVTICDKKDMPNRRTVTRWIADFPDIRAAYEDALHMKAEMYAEELVTLADGASQPLIINGNVVMREGKPVMIVTSEAVAHAKLMVNTRQWIISKLIPKKYGDRVDVTSDGEKISPVTAILMAVQGTALPVIPQGQTIDMDDDEDA